MKARILELSHRHGLGHLSSNLTTADVLEMIAPGSFVILSAGHAGMALYCWLEKHEGANAEQLLNEHGAQPHFDPVRGIRCTTGSLGQGLTVAVGYALADRYRKVHCIISDGECAEGCVWESLAFARLNHLENLIVHVNVNGFAALQPVDIQYLAERLLIFLPWVQIHYTNSEQLPFLRGCHAHYKSMSAAEYESVRGAYV